MTVVLTATQSILEAKTGATTEYLQMITITSLRHLSHDNPNRIAWFVALGVVGSWAWAQEPTKDDAQQAHQLAFAPLADAPGTYVLED